MTRTRCRVTVAPHSTSVNVHPGTDSHSGPIPLKPPADQDTVLELSPGACPRCRARPAAGQAAPSLLAGAVRDPEVT